MFPRRRSADARHARRAGAGPGTPPHPGPRQASSGPVEARGYRLASYLGEGEAEGRAAGWGAAVTQPPGQAARSGFPSPAFPRRWPLPAPHRGVTVPAPARYVSLRALCLPLTGPLCSPVCLTRSAVCGSRCLSQCTCIICSSCLLQGLHRTRSCHYACLHDSEGLSLSVCLPGSCLGLLSGSASASLA